MVGSGTSSFGKYVVELACACGNSLIGVEWSKPQLTCVFLLLG